MNRWGSLRIYCISSHGQPTRGGPSSPRSWQLLVLKTSTCNWMLRRTPDFYVGVDKHVIIIIGIIGIRPLGRSGQRPELSQATGMALVRYILGKFLGVACHCFPRFLDVPTFHHEVPPLPLRRERSQRRKWELWARMFCPVILPKWWLPRHLGIFYMP